MCSTNTPQRSGGTLGSRALVPSAITYKPKINSITVQGGRTRAGAWQEGGEADGGTDTVGRMVNGAAILLGQPEQVVVPAESRAYVSAHGFLKWGTTAMFDIRIFNLDAGYCLRMTPEKDLAKAEKKIRTCTFRLSWSVEGLLLLYSTLRTEYPERRP